VVLASGSSGGVATRRRNGWRSQRIVWRGGVNAVANDINSNDSRIVSASTWRWRNNAAWRQ